MLRGPSPPWKIAARERAVFGAIAVFQPFRTAPPTGLKRRTQDPPPRGYARSGGELARGCKGFANVRTSMRSERRT
jgi:hypothetical protein